MKDPSYERIKSLLNYDPKTGIFTNKVFRGPRAKKNDITGSLTTFGYKVISVDKVSHYAHRLAWIFMFKRSANIFIDHINGDRTDNRISNLREVTKEMNGKNTKIRKNNTSGCSGVSWVEGSRKWWVRASVKGERKNFGLYEDLETAIHIRKKIEKYIGYHENHGRLA